MKRAFFLSLTLGCSSTPTASNPDGGLSGDAAPPDGSVSTDSGPPRDTCKGNPYAAWVSDPRLCVHIFASGLGRVRQMFFAPNEDLFVTGAGKIDVLFDGNRDGMSDAQERETFASYPGLNHGLALSPDNQWVYASTQSSVVRFAYATGSRKASGTPEVVVKGIPGGGHDTRTLVFDREGRLYVNVGSAGNVDLDQGRWSTRAMIRRWSVSNVPPGGFDYDTGEVFASGLRNEVGLFIDSQGRFWGVENGRDNLTDPEFGDITNDNPAEEINRFDTASPGQFFGYPFCWTEGNVSGGLGAGTQWADQTLPAGIQKTDAYCRDEAQVKKPAFAMQGHWAPLGITHYTGNALPFRGDLLVASHGSWNRVPSTGRLIAHAKLDANGNVTSVTPIVGENVGGNLRQGEWEARPVDVREGPDGAVYFSDDDGGRVFRMGYRP